MPDPVFGNMKATAALRGVCLKRFLLIAVEHETAKKPSAKDYIRFPVIRSKHPGKLSLTNAEIEDLLT